MNTTYGRLPGGVLGALVDYAAPVDVDIDEKRTAIGKLWNRQVSQGPHAVRDDVEFALRVARQEARGAAF